MRIIFLFVLIFHTSFLLALDQKLSGSSLHAACSAGNLEIVKLLISHNANFFCENKDGQLAIMLAQEKGYDHIVEFLLNEININAVDIKGDTLLHKICKHNSLDLLKKLLKQKDIAVNILNHKYKTPFYYACRDGSLETAQQLLSHKHTDINFAIPAPGYPTPLQIACMNNHAHIVKILLEQPQIDRHKRLTDNLEISTRDCGFGCQKKDDFTYFQLACRLGAADVVKMLLATKDINKIDINERTTRKKHPLFLALESMNDETFKCILEETDIQESSHSEKYATLFDHISFKENFHFKDEIMLLLVRKFDEITLGQKIKLLGAILNHEEKNLSNLFELLVTKALNERQKKMAVEKSLDCLSEPFNLYNYEYFEINRLFLAALNAYNYDAIHILLKEKFKEFGSIDINATGNHGKTAAYCLSGGPEDSYSDWEDCYGQWNTEPVINILTSLLEYGADPSEVNETGEIPIVHAVEGGNLKALKLLVDYGVDINAPIHFMPPYTQAENVFSFLIIKYHENGHQNKGQKLIDIFEYFLLNNARYCDGLCEECTNFLEKIRMQILCVAKTAITP